MIDPSLGTFGPTNLNLSKHSVNVKLLQPSRVEELREVWELPSHHERRPGHYNPSMSFSSPELVLLTDGAGTLHLVNTGPRAGTAAWEVLFSEEVCGKETPFTILHSRTIDHEEVHCLLLHIDDRSAAGDSKETGPVFLNMVEWVTLVQGDSSTWSVRSVRRLCGPGNLDYTALEDTCSSVYIASDKPFHFTMDSENTISEDKTEPLPITGNIVIIILSYLKMLSSLWY
ncbi:unnamed protein product [Timema podura]|uniref:Uncharacterized protein n=1 Tax=Timema podura TaxID=61482 RepID=A0ABN7P5Z9_TIMPD|nr:unnamed protein product [Timema podura]